eukprot:TRINITY_DN26728_c0_g2_i2.p1 TRINITY_DN26728_c0_g2~~TRINITY_DN26728_c0_g2_i2.p1  ORF type:complete len:128 (+),score=11.92 TRINITY_DN26728_c0_g2_i2:457-840(+)
MSTTSKYQYVQYIVFERYFTLIASEPRSRVASSEQVAKLFYKKRNSQHMGRATRNWAACFLDNNKVLDDRQGNHIKVRSMIEDEDVLQQCKAWLRVQKLESITAYTFARWLNEELHTKLNLQHPFGV